MVNKQQFLMILGFAFINGSLFAEADKNREDWNKGCNAAYEVLCKHYYQSSLYQNVGKRLAAWWNSTVVDVQNVRRVVSNSLTEIDGTLAASQNGLSPQAGVGDSLITMKDLNLKNSQASSIAGASTIVNSSQLQQESKSFIMNVWDSLSTNQKYVFGIVTISTIVAGIAYKLGYFSQPKNKKVTVTIQTVQNIVDSAFAQAVCDSEQDTLNYVIQALVNKGLGNVIVYDNNTFEIEDTFVVELNSDKASVKCK